MKLKIFDEHSVLVEGPYVSGSHSLMLVSREGVVAAARHYTSVVRSLSVAVRELPSDRAALTRRQHSIARLLAENQTDEAIARTLDVSVRTVRSEVAAFSEALGAGSRFAAGVRYGILLSTSQQFRNAGDESTRTH